MKTIGVLVLGIIVVLCFGLLWAFNSPANTNPDPQNQNLVNALNTANHQIDLPTAIRNVTTTKNNLRIGISAANARVGKTNRGGVFARNAIDRILARPGCIGIRYYYAQRDDGTSGLVLVGVSSTGTDMVTAMDVVVDLDLGCPPFCDPTSPLEQ